MIKDVMVWLDGSIADEVRLAAAEDIARVFQGHIIGLFLSEHEKSATGWKLCWAGVWLA